MAPRRRADPEARKGDLVAAARKVFAEKGVANTAVSDVVKVAGVAQGTFYLYFQAKNDVINAVVDQMAEEMVDSIEKAVEAADGAVARLHALSDAILAFAGDPAARELAELYHRPENRAVHDRMAERLLPRLVPLVERIVAAGVAEGVFVAENPAVAAWFILGGFHSLELACSDRTSMTEAVTEATRCAVRALGCSDSNGKHRRRKRP